MQALNPEQQFKMAMLAAGIDPPTSIIPDGELHRFKIGGKLDGAYVLHLTGRAAGYFQDFKQNIKVTWKISGDFTPLTPSEKRDFAIEAHRQALMRQTEKNDRYQAAAQKAAHIWSRATAVVNHPYLERKQVKAHNLRVYFDALVVPLYDKAGWLVSLQFIKADGSKRMMKGGKAQGASCSIGIVPDLDYDKPVLVCEGWATGASLHEATGYFVVIAFSAGNLAAVALQTRNAYQTKEIIICGDNDVSGVGQAAAEASALSIGGRFIIPDQVGQDFNDMINGAAS
ncbi:MAG: toprim domain-containing protein [Methylococcaceae bacterium]